MIMMMMITTLRENSSVQNFRHTSARLLLPEKNISYYLKE